ncbi:PucR family transcriptional regulator ligand-binding domain-containing protein, partial [Kitasatospora sp. NPDC059803]|uniref:PucR family transcriptional regulator ligand-binding domain-containing protein n=1 Tax=Kitasatospora sp. NPDC059803 TaxID=3346953 RepID=UPI003646C3A2
MIVGDLLHLDDLDIRLAWGTPDLLDRPVTGLSSTDLQDPARYLQPGELVLTGLVWWQPADASGALRFATALRSAGVAALLAGEGTHGSVPDSLADACRTHGIPLLAVPAGVSFRAVTDRVYLRLWGDLRAGAQDTAAIPETVRHELLDLLHADAGAGEVLAHAVGRLGVPDCSITTAGGRAVAATATTAVTAVPATAAPVPPAGRGDTGLPVGPQDGSPFDGWRLRPHLRSAAAEPALQALAELLAPLAARAHADAGARRRAAGRLLDALAGEAGLAEPLAACGLGGAESRGGGPAPREPRPAGAAGAPARGRGGAPPRPGARA